MAQAAPAATADRILDSAERLLQVRGFNAFSYADIAAELDIRKASIHYHFPTKTELCRSLLRRYRTGFRGLLEAIERGTDDPARKLRDYAGLYRQVLRQGRMCLCGMLASDYATLPRPVRQEVKGFFDDNELWLSAILSEARQDGLLRYEGNPRDLARLFVAGLEGAMLVARCYGEVAHFDGVAERLLAELGVTAG